MEKTSKTKPSAPALPVTPDTTEAEVSDSMAMPIPDGASTSASAMP